MPARSHRQHSIDVDLMRAVLARLTDADSAMFDELVKKAEAARDQARTESEAVEQQRRRSLSEVERAEQVLAWRKDRFARYVEIVGRQLDGALDMSADWDPGQHQPEIDELLAEQPPAQAA
jgi:hypothetical protein